jgi:hyperosmotically inducible protein
MKQVLLSLLIILVTATFLMGCAEDARINAAIKGKLAEEERIDLSRVGVDTQHGSVYLSGVVPSAEYKSHIEQIAREEATGPVINQLRVRPVVEDAVLTSSVKGRLMNDRLINAAQIGVETQEGIVSLYGIVPSVDQKRRAEVLTRQTIGVRQVVNVLQVNQVTPPLMPSDAMITATVKEKLTTDRFANLARVHVDTNDGVVYLNGVVPSNDHKFRAEQVTRDVKGVNQVVNNLQVQP